LFESLILNFQDSTSSFGFSPAPETQETSALPALGENSGLYFN